MSGVPFDESGLQGLTDVAKSIVVGIADFLKAILAQITQLIVQISIPLALVLILTGSILYFSHLNRRLGRDFVILSIVLALVNQIFK
jgi:hypothetical protein